MCDIYDRRARILIEESGNMLVMKTEDQEKTKFQTEKERVLKIGAQLLHVGIFNACMRQNSRTTWLSCFFLFKKKVQS
jgi:uncharacterized membrane protein YiaA